MSTIIENQGKGIRLRANKTTVRKEKNGQFKTTIPSFIAEIMNLKDRSVIKWRTLRDSIEITIDTKNASYYESELEKKKQHEMNL